MTHLDDLVAEHGGELAQNELTFLRQRLRQREEALLELGKKVVKLEALAAFAWHDADCDLVLLRIPNCSCGFWAARNAAR